MKNAKSIGALIPIIIWGAVELVKTIVNLVTGQPKPNESQKNRKGGDHE